MKLRNYMLMLTGTVALCLILLFSVPTRLVLNKGLGELERKQQNARIALVHSVLELKHTQLKALVKTLSADNAFMAAISANNAASVKKRLETLETEINLDFITIGGKGQFQRGTHLIEMGGKNLFIHGLTAGSRTLVFGFYLNGGVTNDLLNLQSVPVYFEFSDDPIEHNVAHIDLSHSEIRLLSTAPLRVRFLVDEVSEPIENAGNTVFLLLLCLSVLVVVIIVGGGTFLFHRKFVTPFSQSVTRLHQAAGRLKDGVVEEPAFGASGLNEMNQLNNAISAYAKRVGTLKQAVEQQTRHEAELEKQRALAHQAQDFAHNIKSPAVSLVSNLDLIEDRIPEKTHTLMKNAALGIWNKASDLLKTRRSDTVVSPINGPVFLGPLVQEIATRKSIEHPQYRIFPYISPSALSAFSRIDRFELSQAISNMVNNAIEAASNQEGSITICLVSTGNTHRISVRDRGQGISKEVLAHLGERGLTSGKDNGNGLGLSHARQLAEKAGGSLFATSSPKEGTEVGLELPAAKIPKEITGELTLKKGARVLIVESDQGLIDAWKELLSFESVQEQEVEIHLLSKLEDLREFTASSPLVEQDIILTSKSAFPDCLDTINALGLGPHATIVSNVPEKESLRKRIGHMKSRLLWRQAVSFLVINFPEADITEARS